VAVRTDDDETTIVPRAALGEILPACPRCGGFDLSVTNQGRSACAACGLRFLVPAYFQRVPPPAADPPADPPGAAPAGLTREQIAAVLAKAHARKTPDPAA
jgi:hypothetical protein